MIRPKLTRQSALRFVRRKLVFGAAIILCGFLGRNVVAQGFWDQLSSQNQLFEARAAYHLGILDAGATALPIQNAWTLAGAVAARTDATSMERIQAYRLKLLIADRLGNTNLWQLTFQSLPSSLPEIPAAQWNRQKLLWQMMHMGNLGEWTNVRASLASFGVPKDAPGVFAADLALLRCRSEIRETQGAASGYISLAHAVANLNSLEIPDPNFDPYYAITDFTPLDSWPVIKQVMAILTQEGGASLVAQRRWFEFAAPSSINPLGSLFPEAPKAEQTDMKYEFYNRVPQFIATSTVAPSQVGGFRELLSYEIMVENLAYAGEPGEILNAVAGMPPAIAGIPDELWNGGYKVGWRTIGDAGSLAVGSLLEELPTIMVAADRLPHSPMKGFVYALSGLVLLSQSDTRGNVQFAKALKEVVPHPLLLGQMTKGLCSSNNMDSFGQIIGLLGEPTYEAAAAPQALASRAMFVVRRGENIDAEHRTELFQSAIDDGAQALNNLEGRMDPFQIHWRKQLSPVLTQAVSETKGVEAAAQMKVNFARGVQDSSLLNVSLRSSRRHSNPIFSSVVSSFDSICEQAPLGDSTATRHYLHQLDNATVASAVDALPSSYKSSANMRGAFALLEEVSDRGLDRASSGIGDWNRVQLRHGELLLCNRPTALRGRKMIETLADDPASSLAVKGEALTILDALTTMQSMDAYLWAQEWCTFLEREYPVRRPYLTLSLARPLAEAGNRPEIKARLSDPNIQVFTRLNETYNIAMANIQIRNDERAMELLNGMIDSGDAEMQADDVVRPVAEVWRLYVLWRQAGRTQDAEKRRDLYQTITDYVGSRINTLGGTDEVKIKFAQWGEAAARKAGDDVMVDTLRALASQEVKTKTF